MRLWLMVLGATTGLFGAAGVALAAAGAHLAGAPIVTTAANFLLFHAGALAGLCAVGRLATSRWLLTAMTLVGLGTILFSGDLALRGLAGIALVPEAAPTGGVLMIVGWLVAAIALPLALRRTPASVEPSDRTLFDH